MLRLVAAALPAVLPAALLAALVAPAPAYAEEVDTTPPRVALDPCHWLPEAESCGQREHLWVAGLLGEGDDLAVLGATVDGAPVAEQVYDDGTGFVPHGWFAAPYNDVIEYLDYALVVPIPPGEHEVTFYARDLAGNEATHTRSVVGAEVPSRVPRLRARVRPHKVVVSWRWPDAHGSYVWRYRISVPCRDDVLLEDGVPSSPPTRFVLRGLERGRHVVRVRATNGVGEGPPARVVVRVR